jgi:hypothetical protein
VVMGATRISNPRVGRDWIALAAGCALSKHKG